ncbi:MAG: hypothetical protein ACRD4P_07585 [Bryobacteraceae bacterium]
MLSWKYSLLPCVLAAAGLIQAQESVAAVQRDNVMIAQKIVRDNVTLAMPAVQVMGAEFNYDKLVKNAPYTADAVSETTQTRADGNRITHKSTTSLARDSAGRTRREETLGAVGPWSTGNAEPSKIVFINDPVAQTNYVLEPNHVARMTKVESPDAATAKAMDEAKAKAAPDGMASGERHGDFFFTSTAPAPPPPPPGMMGAAVTTSAGPGPNVVFYNKLSAEAQNTKTDNLGQQTIQGVVAQGHRTTMTIPAGQMGNERPIEIVNETWYSPELQTTVMSKRSDPRFGDTTYQLTNIERAEPDPMLFQVPSDYKVEDAPQRVFKMRIDPGAPSK